MSDFTFHCKRPDVLSYTIAGVVMAVCLYALRFLVVFLVLSVVYLFILWILFGDLDKLGVHINDLNVYITRYKSPMIEQYRKLIIDYNTLMDERNKLVVAELHAKRRLCPITTDNGNLCTNRRSSDDPDDLCEYHNKWLVRHHNAYSPNQGIYKPYVGLPPAPDMVVDTIKKNIANYYAHDQLDYLRSELAKYSFHTATKKLITDAIAKGERYLQDFTFSSIAPLEDESDEGDSVDDAPNHDDNDHRSLCVVCWEEIPDTIYFPCRHLVCCSECSSSLNACPVCRAKINNSFAVYTA